MKSAFAVLYMAAGFYASLASAEESILVTASRTEAKGVTVLDRAAIDALQPVSVLEVIDRAAGVRAYTKGGAGGSSYVSVRGGEPNFTLILLDGLKVNDPTNSQGGAFDLAQIDPQALDRVELARGARSSVHGADALAGVVNLRLRNVGDGERFTILQTNLDSEAAYGIAGTTAVGWDGGDLLVSGSHYDSGNLTEGSDLSRWQLLAKASQAIGGHRLTMMAIRAQTEREAFPEDSGGPRLAVIREREMRDTRLIAAGLGFEGAGSDMRPTMSLNWSRQEANAATPPIPPQVPAIVAVTRFDRLEALAGLKLYPAASVTLALGANYVDEDGRSRGEIDFGEVLPADFDAGRRTVSAFGETTYESGPWTATASVRFDNPSRAASEWTSRAALRLGPVFASYAEGYKLPSLYALHYPLIANPTLAPERSRSFEAGLESNVGAGKLRVAYFNSRFRNLIDFDPAIFTNVNRARVVTEGVELETKQRVLTGWDLRGTLTYLEVESESPLRSRPRWQGSAAAEWQAAKRLLITVGGRFNSDFIDSSVPTGPIDVAGHVEVDFAARYALGATTIQITARNLLAADYEDAVGFPASRRVIRLTLGRRL